MWKVNLANSNSEILHTSKVNTDDAGGETTQLIIQTIAQTHATFKSVTNTSSGTSIITAPNINGAIVLVDLIVTSQKSTNNSVVVQMTDGVETIVIIDVPVDNGLAFGIGFQGQWIGWKNARLEIVTAATFDATAAAGYYKIKEGLNFADWDARR